MSQSNNYKEALRWLSSGQDDLDTAIILQMNKKHAHACFHAQQAVEKSIKGVWYFFDLDPWGHSILKLIEDLQGVKETAYEIFASYIPDARHLDRLYIPTRYPNGLPDITPDMAYGPEDSQASISAARKIVKEVEKLLNKGQ